MMNIFPYFAMSLLVRVASLRYSYEYLRHTLLKKNMKTISQIIIINKADEMDFALTY